MRGAALRWTLCAILALGAHGLAYYALTSTHAEVDPDAGSPVITLDLSPVMAAPAPQSEDTPTDTAADTPPAPVAEAAPPPPPPPSPTPTETPTPQPAHSPEPPPAPVATPDAPPPPPSPTVTPEPTPVKETPPPVVAPPQPASPPPSASSVSAASTAATMSAPSRAPGREEAVSPAALRTWQRELIAQIERHKRFPEGAGGRSGVVKVAFGIDREGRLTEARVIASSGSPALDEAALDLIRHAQPFPAPPAGMGERELSFVAPIRYLARATR